MSDQTRQSAGWQVEQSASEAYEEYLVPAIFAPWTERLLETGEIREGDRVLDVGCGTGIVARRAAPRVGPSGGVTGLDINDGMLAVAEETAAELKPSVEWRQGSATDLPFSEGEFDVVCSQQALQFFDEPRVAVEEMRRVLRPGGCVALSVWRPLDFQPAYIVLADALEQCIDDQAGEMMGSPFPAWDGADLRALLRDAGFDDVSVRIEIGSVRYPSVAAFIRREVASSPLAEPIAAVEPAVREELIRAVADGVDTYVDDEGIVSPMESYVITGKR